MTETLTFPQELKQLLKSEGRSQVWLASKMKCTPQTITNKLRLNSFSPSEESFIRSLLK